MGLLEPDERHRRRDRAARLKSAGTTRKAVVIHSLAHARAALAAASALRLPIVLLSGTGAGGYAGAAWFLEVARQARAEFPNVKVDAVLDCAAAPGRALSALRLGAKRLRLGGNPRATTRVAEVAKQADATLDDSEYALLDLATAKDLEQTVRDYLVEDIPLTLPSPPDGGRGMRKVGATPGAPYPKLGEGGKRRPGGGEK